MHHVHIDLLWLKIRELKQNNFILQLLLYLQLKSIPSSKESRMHVFGVHKIKIWIAKNNLNTQKKTPEIHVGKLIPKSKEKSVKLLSTLKVRKLKFHEEHICNLIQNSLWNRFASSKNSMHTHHHDLVKTILYHSHMHLVIKENVSELNPTSPGLILR